MNNIIVNTDSDLSGDNENNTNLATIKAIYREITSKQQQLTKTFKEAHVCDFDDFKQLMKQLYQVISE